jgi:DNA-binding NarL/FixJ family response regulator
MEPVKREKKIKVLIADDHPVVLEGLALMLKQAADIAVIGFAKNNDELINRTKKLNPDVVILDLMMPGSTPQGNVKELKALKTKPAILCCSSVTDGAVISDLVKSGISGYIMKSTTVVELQTAIRKIAEGGNYFSEEAAGILESLKTVGEQADQDTLFTDKELEIIKMICCEKTAKEISEQLSINIRTLESVKVRIMKKMDVKNTAALVYYALKNKLFDINDLTK